jgi:hypothetical protein
MLKPAQKKFAEILVENQQRMILTVCRSAFGVEGKKKRRQINGLAESRTIEWE